MDDHSGTQSLPEPSGGSIVPPRVSIVIVTRNQSNGLRRCLQALEQSTIASQLEIIVVDNNSRDGSHLLEDEFQNVTYLKLPKNFGWTKAANIALRSTHADLILFLDPRVELAPPAVEALADKVLAEGEAAAATPFLSTPSGDVAKILRKLPSATDLQPAYYAPSESAEPVTVEYPGAYCLMVRKPFLKGMNFLDERYGDSWSDAEIAVQVRRAGRKIQLLPNARGVWHEEDAPPALPDALFKADFEQGAATYLSKHFGGGAGRRISATLGALLGLQFGLFSNLISGQKVDGTQE